MSPRLVALLALACAAAPAAAAPPSPLDRVPPGSPLIISVRGHERAVDRLTAFFDAALPDVGGQLTDLLKSQLDDLLAGRNLADVPADRPILLAWLDLPGTGFDSLAILLPADEPTKVRDSVLTAVERKAIKTIADGLSSAKSGDSELFLVELPGHVALTFTRKTADRLLAVKDGVAGKWPAGFADALLSPDLGVFVDLPAFKAKFATELLAVKVALLGELPSKGTPLLEQMDRPDRAVLKRFIIAALQLFDDGGPLVAGADFRPDGVSARVRLRFPPNGRTGKLLAKLTAEPFAGLEELPAGQAAYLGARLDEPVRQMLTALQTDSALLAGDGRPALKSDDTKTAKAALEAWSAAGPVRLRLAADFPTGSLTLVDGDDRDALLATTRDYYAGLPAGARIGGVPLKTRPTWGEKEDFNRTRPGGADVDLDRLAAREPAGERAALLSAQRRRLGTRAGLWLFGTDDGVGLLTGPDPAAAKARLTASVKLGDDEAYSLTRARLPRRATAVALLDAGRCASGLAGVAGAIFQGTPTLSRGELLSTAPYRGRAAFAGLAVRAEGEVLHGDFYLPASAVEAMRAVLEPLAADAEDRP